MPEKNVSWMRFDAIGDVCAFKEEMDGTCFKIQNGRTRILPTLCAAEGAVSKYAKTGFGKAPVNSDLTLI